MARYRIVNTGQKSLFTDNTFYALERKTLFGWKHVITLGAENDEVARQRFYQVLKPKPKQREVIVEFDESSLGVLCRPKPRVLQNPNNTVLFTGGYGDAPIITSYDE